MSSRMAIQVRSLATAFAVVVPMVERLPCKQLAPGSNPGRSFFGTVEQWPSSKAAVCKTVIRECDSLLFLPDQETKYKFGEVGLKVSIL